MSKYIGILVKVLLSLLGKGLAYRIRADLVIVLVDLALFTFNSIVRDKVPDKGRITKRSDEDFPLPSILSPSFGVQR